MTETAERGWRSDRARVTGQARYAGDVPCPDALFAAFLLSTERHARIRSIDSSAVEELDGVVAVLTGADIGERLFGRSLRDYPILAVDRVRFVGQRVAAVAAVDEATAREAVDAIVVDYEPLEALLTLGEALAADVVLHDEPSRYVGADDDHPEGNYQGGVAAREGEDIDAAFRACDAEYEHEFTWGRNHSAPLEAHACLVVPGEERTTVYSAHKEPYALQRSLAYLTGRPEEHFDVEPIPIGGDFGAKAAPFLEAACYLLAERTGRPVRSTMGYFEELTSTAARHPGRMRLRTGLRDGRIHAFEAETLLDGGAYAGLKPLPTRIVPFVGLPMAHYRVANSDERLAAVYTNTLPAGHVRSPGEFKAVFAGESHLDMMARARGVDPVDFRLQHVAHPETERILQRLREIVADWRSELPDDTGIGIAVFDRSPGAGRTRVVARADRDGVHLQVPVPDQGSGMYATFQRMAADTLGIERTDITIDPVGAEPGLTDRGAGASRVTIIAGGAVVDACRHLIGELGGIPVDGGEGLNWIATRLTELDRDEVITEGEVETTQRGTPSYGGLAIQIHVDRGTGRVEGQRAHLVVDGGRVWNPVGYRGQLEGGFVYGLSQTLYEDLVVEDGQVVTASLGDYKLACASDVPPLGIELLPPLPDQDPDEIRGGVGELSNIGVAAAVANAIEDAVGVRVTQLPITAEAVWRSLRERPAG